MQVYIVPRVFNSGGRWVEAGGGREGGGEEERLRGGGGVTRGKGRR